jgi:hypothetical protein
MFDFGYIIEANIEQLEKPRAITNNLFLKYIMQKKD